MPKIRLNQQIVDAYPCVDKVIVLHDTQIKGLQLRITPTDRRSFYIDYYADSGRRTYRIGSTRQYKLVRARKEAQRLFGLIANGEDPSDERDKVKLKRLDGSNPKLIDYLDGPFTDLHLVHQRSGQFTKDRIKVSFKPFLNLKLKDVTPQKINLHRHKRLTIVKANTVNREMAALSALFSHAVEHEVIDISPFKHRILKPLPMENTSRVRWLGQYDEHSDHEVGEKDRFIAALEDAPIHLKLMCLLAMNTGLRKGEVFSLSFSDINFEQKKLTIRAINSKSKKARTIPLNAAALDVLQQARQLKESPLVFTSPVTGRAYKSIYPTFKKVCAEADLQDFTFHSLRHHFASVLAMKSVSLLQIQKLLGHSDYRVTMAYAHLSPDTLQSAVDLL